MKLSNEKYKRTFRYAIVRSFQKKHIGPVWGHIKRMWRWKTFDLNNTEITKIRHKNRNRKMRRVWGLRKISTKKYKYREALARRDGPWCNKCWYRPKLQELTLDHIIPSSKGGRTMLSNLQLLCRRCNQEKKDILPSSYPHNVI